MVSPFGPVEALPSKSTARRLQAGHIETDVAKPLDAEGAYIKSLVWKRNDEPSFTQSLRYGDAYLPGQVIVAAPGEPQFLCGRAECFSADQPGWPNRGKIFDCLSDVSAGKSIVAMPSFRLRGYETTCEQL